MKPGINIHYPLILWNNCTSFLIPWMLLILVPVSGVYTQVDFIPSDGVSSGEIEYNLFSTGQMTGTIGRATFSNQSEDEISIILYPAFIPSSEGFQSYILPDTTKLSLLPNSKLTVDLIGYCANPFQDPVPFGQLLPDFSNWVFPQLAFENGQLNRKKLWEDQLVPFFSVLKNLGLDTICLINPISEGCLPINLYPLKYSLIIKDSIDPHFLKTGLHLIDPPKICLDVNREIAGHLLLDAIILIEYIINEEGFTYSIPDKLRVSNLEVTLAQIAIWKYSSGLMLKNFPREILFHYVLGHLESVIGKENLPLLFQEEEIAKLSDLYYDQVEKALKIIGLCH
jgi:hypothetical protein